MHILTLKITKEQNINRDKFSPIRPWQFRRESRFEASRAVFWSLPGYKQRKLTRKPFARRALRGLLIEMQNICL